MVGLWSHNVSSHNRQTGYPGHLCPLVWSDGSRLLKKSVEGPFSPRADAGRGQYPRLHFRAEGKISQRGQFLFPITKGYSKKNPMIDDDDNNGNVDDDDNSVKRSECPTSNIN